MKQQLQKTWEKRPLIISGPCSAESEEQVMQTAQRLANTGKVDMLRAGIWKPRTKPGQFEGLGTQALPWLLNAKKLTGLQTTVEVANAKHVEEALQFEVDVLWIGARTTVNPFSIQEIANALRGVDIPVLVKNPVHPDIDLWSGAIERLQKAGVQDTGMIHRGFSSYGNTEYRNAPMWHLPIEMKRRYPGMLLLCDPSHICGNRVLLQQVAQKSIDLDFGGLMLESHIDPDNAWSDAKQQVTPERLDEILNSLTWRRENSDQQEFIGALSQLREQINQVDDELLSLMSQRMKLADKIGMYKRENNITILQTTRWNDILERAFDKGAQLGLGKEFITRYFDAVHLESINHQNKIMNE
ncbi:MAG: chorismate mutase [Ferruginibacter sp.]